MRRPWTYAILLTLLVGTVGCSQDSARDKQLIVQLTTKNAELVRANQDLQAANEKLLQFAQQGIDLLNQNIAEERIKQEQRALDAVVTYWCRWGPLSLCPAALIRNDVDITLAPSHPYFYLGAMAMLLMLGIAVGGAGVGAWTCWQYVLRPTKQKIAAAMKIIFDARAEQEKIREQRITLDRELAGLAELKTEQAAIEREICQKGRDIERLQWKELDERTRIETQLVRFERQQREQIAASIQASDGRLHVLEGDISELENRRGRLQKEIAELLELEKQAAIRREHFGALFRPQKYREQQEARHDPHNASDATQNSKDSAK